MPVNTNIPVFLYLISIDDNNRVDYLGIIRLELDEIKYNRNVTTTFLCNESSWGRLTYAINILQLSPKKLRREKPKDLNDLKDISPSKESQKTLEKFKNPLSYFAHNKRYSIDTYVNRDTIDMHRSEKYTKARQKSGQKFSPQEFFKKKQIEARCRDDNDGINTVAGLSSLTLANQMKDIPSKIDLINMEKELYTQKAKYFQNRLIVLEEKINVQQQQNLSEQNCSQNIDKEISYNEDEINLKNKKLNQKRDEYKKKKLNEKEIDYPQNKEKIENEGIKEEINE